MTEAEARVVAVLLAARPDRERERLKQVGVPRSTYYAVRRRAYSEGWLQDRYVPDPARISLPYATFVLVRPFADHLDEIPSGGKGMVNPTVLWAGSQFGLAVLFHATSEEGAATAEKWESLGWIASHVALTVDLRGPTVPVFFDFEGLWNHWTGALGTLAYPHGLGGTSTDAEPLAALTPHTRWAYANLLRRPFSSRENGGDGHQLGAFGLPFSERRLLARGWVTHRVLLDPSRVPPYGGRALAQVFFVRGSPRPGARAEQLFSRLTRECRAFPFLYVVAPNRWLIGAMGGPSPPPSVTDDRRERSPVLAELRGFLEEIQIFHEPPGSLSLRIDHRYDDLVPARDSARR